MSDPVTREEFAMLASRVTENARRIDMIDSGGTRGVAVLAVQVQEVAKDVAAVAKDMEAHDQRHEKEQQQRASNRKWMVGAVIAGIAAIDGPIVSVLLAVHGAH